MILNDLIKVTDAQFFIVEVENDPLPKLQIFRRDDVFLTSNFVSAPNGMYKVIEVQTAIDVVIKIAGNMNLNIPENERHVIYVRVAAEEEEAGDD